MLLLVVAMCYGCVVLLLYHVDGDVVGGCYCCVVLLPFVVDL